MKKTQFLLLPVIFAGSASAAVLFSDNFDTTDGRLNDELPPAAGRLSGSLSGDMMLTSHRAHQLLVSNQLEAVATAGFRFENSSLGGAGDRYDWAAGSASQQIIDSLGLNVSFDWVAPENAADTTQWIAWAVGTNNADSGNSVVNEPANDYGILFRVNGDTERFDNGANLGAAGSFSAASNVHTVSIDFSFSSWADGSDVTATSSVDGVQVASDTFQWDGNSGAFFMEFAANNTGSRIDNLTVSTLGAAIPEPSTSLLSGLALLGLLCRRSR